MRDFFTDFSDKTIDETVDKTVDKIIDAIVGSNMQHTFQKTIRNYSRAALISMLVLTPFLQGCAPLLIGAGIGAVVSTDRRPTVLQASDRTLQVELTTQIKQEFPQSYVELAVWNRQVLLLGSVPNESIKQLLGARVKATPGVGQVVNELVATINPSLVSRGNDTVLTGRIKTSLIATQGINSNSIKIVTNGAKVYIMGWATSAERPLILHSVRHTLGVVEVIDLMEEAV